MSTTEVRQFFRDRMELLGHTEWPEPFTIDDIPDQMINDEEDTVFNIETNTFNATLTGQKTLSILSDHTVRLVLNGGLNTSAGIDEAIRLGEEAYMDIVASSVRLTQTNIKNVIFNTMDVVPYSVNNDNKMVVELSFTARIECEV